MAESNEDDEKSQLKAALHYAVGKICEMKSDEHNVTYSKAFIACLTETVVNKIELFATDLEAFAKHAKRTTINIEDVKLLVRRNPGLAEEIETCSKSLIEKHKPKIKKIKS
ncbi:centromere protein S [Hydra vulgaris]|uniref:Centromere protein S n=1 Tax=Hydra vulgaris TaxID=6087 RepID=A0ABM4CRM2_HYDVU